MQSHCSHIIPNQCFYDLNVRLSAVKGAFLFNCFMNKGGPTLQMHITCHHSVHQFNYFLSRLFNIFTFYFSIFRVMRYTRSRCCHFLLHPDTHCTFSIYRKDKIPLSVKGKIRCIGCMFFVTCHLYEGRNNAQSYQGTHILLSYSSELYIQYIPKII